MSDVRCSTFNIRVSPVGLSIRLDVAGEVIDMLLADDPGPGLAGSIQPFPQRGKENEKRWR